MAAAAADISGPDADMAASAVEVPGGSIGNIGECFLTQCQAVIVKEWRGVFLSEKGWNAVRAYRLQLKGNAKMLKESADKL
eukprot:2859816-Pyramimonas_sp.AAC.1